MPGEGLADYPFISFDFVSGHKNLLCGIEGTLVPKKLWSQ